MQHGITSTYNFDSTYFISLQSMQIYTFAFVEMVFQLPRSGHISRPSRMPIDINRPA